MIRIVFELEILTAKCVTPITIHKFSFTTLSIHTALKLKHMCVWEKHTQTHTQHAAQVLDICHTHSDFWLELLWVTCPPAELCGCVQCTEGCMNGWGEVEVIVSCLYTGKETSLTSKDGRENTRLRFQRRSAGTTTLSALCSSYSVASRWILSMSICVRLCV